MALAALRLRNFMHARVRHFSAANPGTLSTWQNEGLWATQDSGTPLRGDVSLRFLEDSWIHDSMLK